MEGGNIGENLRWLFISFLFATVTSEIAAKFSVLLREWRRLTATRWPALSYLILAAVIVITSWIGWSLDLMHRGNVQVSQVFSLPTLILIVDFALLVCYYALVKGIEFESGANDRKHLRPALDSRDPALWSMWILGLYFVWDFLNDEVVYPKGYFWIRGYPSAVWTGLAVLVFVLLRKISPNRPALVCCGNISLVLLFLSYRAMKQWETTLPLDHRHLVASVSLVVVSFVLSGTAALKNRRPMRKA